MNGNVDRRIDASRDIARANAIGVVIHVGTYDERAVSGAELQCDIRGSCDRLRTRECKSTREVACCAQGPAPLDPCGELGNCRGGKYRNEAGREYDLDE